MDDAETTIISFTPKSVQQTLSITAGLRVTLWEVLVKDLVTPAHTSKFQEFYNSVYPKWFFNALRRGQLDPETFQLTATATLNTLVLQSDLAYFQNAHKIAVKPLTPTDAPLIEAIPIALAPLSASQKTRAFELYTGDPSEFAQSLAYLQGLYDGLGGSSNFFSVPPSVKNGYTELFGSPFNTNGPYCSAFEYEKQFFGSLGSFFDYELESGTHYMANPPFDEQMMETMALRLNQQLAKHENVTIVVTIPDWRPPFDAMDILNACQYRSSSCKLDRFKHQFFDHRTDSLIKVCFSRLYILTNNPWSDTSVTADKIADKWMKEVRKANPEDPGKRRR
jgi:hypothetical protein